MKNKARPLEFGISDLGRDQAGDRILNGIYRYARRLVLRSGVTEAAGDRDLGPVRIYKEMAEAADNVRLELNARIRTLKKSNSARNKVPFRPEQSIGPCSYLIVGQGLF